MPRPRRRTPRRLKRPPTPSEELAMWSVVFRSGCDFFNDLAPLGHGRMHPDFDERAMAAAGAAWARLGWRYMQDEWKPGSRRDDRPPWAVEVFGLPAPPPPAATQS